jgi:hypothetical protein
LLRCKRALILMRGGQPVGTLFDVPRILPVEFTAFLVAKQGANADLATALRLWGCAAQAGIFVGGLLLSPSGKAATPLEEFAPLKSLTLPAAEDTVGEAASGLGRELAEVVSAAASSSPRPKIDQAAGSVVLFLPGFDKTEVRALHILSRPSSSEICLFVISARCVLGSVLLQLLCCDRVLCNALGEVDMFDMLIRDMSDMSTFLCKEIRLF